jgi:hypothetical protein
MVIPTCVGEKAADLVVVIDSCNLRRSADLYRVTYDVIHYFMFLCDHKLKLGGCVLSVGRLASSRCHKKARPKPVQQYDDLDAAPDVLRGDGFGFEDECDGFRPRDRHLGGRNLLCAVTS